MADRTWFFASHGQQQGPYPEAQLRELITSGTVTAETLVWSEGMTGWEKAGDIQGLFSGYGAPPVIPQPGRPSTGGLRNGPLSIELEIGEFTWRSLLFLLGLILIIPTPWVVVWYLNWLLSCVRVPGRPNLSFTGQPLIIAAWYFGAMVLSICVALSGVRGLNNLTYVVQLVLYWMFLKYFVANLASNGQPLGLSFSGSFWAYVGWTLLTVISVLTIIGWAWVYAAQMRWVCRNIQGTRREVVFNGTGLQYLWRLLVVAIASSFIIPIPWVFRWIMDWQLSQTELIDRTA